MKRVHEQLESLEKRAALAERQLELLEDLKRRADEAPDALARWAYSEGYKFILDQSVTDPHETDTIEEVADYLDYPDGKPVSDDEIPF